MIGIGTIDEFVRTVLETKSHIIDQLVEGSALPEDFQQDVMSELRRVMGVLEPKLDKLPADEVDEKKVVELLRDAGTAFVETAAERVPATTLPAASNLPSPEAVSVLARVLAGPDQASYRIESSSKPGEFYELEVDGSDVGCSCKGFSYRGACQHARALKEALVAGGDLPKGFIKVSMAMDHRLRPLAG